MTAKQPTKSSKTELARERSPTGHIAAIEADTRTQSERFIAKARELVLDEREETFDAALTKVAQRRKDKG